MIPAPIPANDAARLQALRELLILDTPPEERFDRIVHFAKAEFDVPIALITLVDESRQWFKAKVGLDTCETSRDVSFCAHAVAAAQTLIVEDATRDERFFDNPLVLGDPFVRFYAGAPLNLSSGASVGSLCVIDSQPRSFDAVDRAILENLRDLAIEELERRAQAA